MDLNVTTHGSLTVAAGLPRMFDYTVCPDVQRALAPCVDACPRVLLLDLSGVEFMDSSAIGTLITMRNRLLPAGGGVALCSLGEGVAKVFRIADLGRIFAIHDDVAAALAAYAS